MRKLTLFAAIIFIAASCSINRNAKSPDTGSAMTNANPNLSIIEGKWNQGKPAEIMLFDVRNGQFSKIAVSVLDDNNNFFFAFTPDREAFYVLGLNDKMPVNNYMFYIKPGDRLGVSIENDTYTLVGANTSENIEMERWHNWLSPIEIKSLHFTKTMSTYEDFFPQFEELLAKGFTPAATGNQKFDDAFTNFRESYLFTLAVNFLMTPRTKHPNPDDLPDFYRTFSLESVATAQLMNYPYGISLLNSYPMLYQTVNKENMSDEDKQKLSSLDERIRLTTAMISDPGLKGEYLLNLASGIKTYEGYLDFEGKYSDDFVTPTQKVKFKQLLKEIPIPDSSLAVDFRFPDINGNMVSLSDFKGKVVYIDVWATWCGPCMAQMPHLKKLEEEYHDNPNIVFMSVSSDKSKDHQKWLDVIAKEGLGGVQLFGGDDAYQNLMTPYKISGIPRFMLIGKDGRIINMQAPRPSSDEIRPLLNAALNK